MISCGMMYVLSSVNIGTDVQAILWSRLNSPKGCNIGVEMGRTYEVQCRDRFRCGDTNQASQKGVRKLLGRDMK
jgi:hypothetical protein